MTQADSINTNNNFDLIRLFAALQVLVLHHLYLFYNNNITAFPLVERLLWFFPGVNIFFIISGYLIFSSLQRNSLSEYFKRRFLRIFPALLICLLVTTSILIFSGRLTKDELTSPDFFLWIGAQSTVFQFYNPEIVRDFGIGPPNGALWTVSTEIQFYIVTAFLWHSFLSRKSKKTQSSILIVLAISSAFANLFINSIDPDKITFKLLNASFLGYYYFFLAGALVHLHWNTLSAFFVNRFRFWFIPYLILLAILIWYQINLPRYEFGFKNLLLLIMLTGLTFSAAFSKPFLAKKLLNKNDISYGIYLYHMLLVNLAVEINFNLSPLHMFITMLFSIIAGALSWIFIEKPLLRRRGGRL